MSKYVHILDLNNAFEASLLDEVLNDHGVPHAIVSTGDSAFGGIENMESGYGYVSAPEEFRARIVSIMEEIREP
ncbi:MAG TPA: hypothetical protein P5550_00835 [Bacteroidales bacterium]|nr:hypothetical protein [Bacteroidales bacterium]HRZ77963.1 hypothetical protein [Bacteroidales bacterium]